MNKQDLINKINESAISDFRKLEILKLINDNELDDDTMDQIKGVIQEDIDENVNEMLSDDQKKQIVDLETTANTEIKTIATEMTEDMKYVEVEMADLDGMLNTLNSTVESMSVDKVKSDLDKISE